MIHCSGLCFVGFWHADTTDDIHLGSNNTERAPSVLQLATSKDTICESSENPNMYALENTASVVIWSASVYTYCLSHSTLNSIPYTTGPSRSSCANSPPLRYLSTNTYLPRNTARRYQVSRPSARSRARACSSRMLGSVAWS
jgi:hypothetical protein